MQHVNDNSKVLWIGDLQSWMDQSYLTSLIDSLGYKKELYSVKLIKHKQTGLPLKYGFLQFTSHEAAQNFYQNYDTRTIPNTTKHFKLNWASYGANIKAPTHTKNNQEIQIYIGDLDPSVTEHKLLELFRTKYPSVFNAKVITDGATKISKGYGFVKFTNAQQSNRAISEMNGFLFQGKILKVSTAHSKPKEENQENNEELQSQLLFRQKLYAQFYSNINDPQMKVEYEKQVIKTFGEQQAKKLSLKQSLEGVRSLSFSETKPSLKLLSVIPKAVNSNLRASMEQKIYR